MAESPSAPNNLPFAGYENLQSNYVYTPNQFFDVVVPHSDRGVLRIVGYLIRRQLGYMTAEGEPQEPIIGVSHRELVSKAKVSSGALAPAIRKAIELNFIEEIRPGRASSQGDKGVSALYSLKWDEGAAAYVTNINEFQGFYAKEGNRTPIPNQFFDVTLRKEAASVISVVGLVIRWSIGFTTKYGARRQNTALAVSRISDLSGLGRTIVHKATKTAIARGYILEVEKGIFDSRSVVRKASVYQVNWADGEETASKSDTAKSPLIPVSEFEAPQKVIQHTASKSNTGAPQKVAQKTASKSGTNKRNLINNTSKQQQAAVAAEEIFDEKFSLLQKAGFDVRAAYSLAERADLEVIQNQIDWIDQRNATSNKLGLLRKAIEENFDEPQCGSLAGGKSDFIQSFQEALGQGNDQWLSPSPLEIRTAEEFAAKLTKDFGGDAQTWGKEFGRFVKHELGNRHRSLEKTIRFQASKFISIQRQRSSDRKRQERERAEDERNRKVDEVKKQWLGYLQEQVEEVKTLHPERFQEFEAKRAKERKEIANDPTRGSLFLTMFDTPAWMLEEFAKQFSDIVLTEDKFITNVK